MHFSASFLLWCSIILDDLAVRQGVNLPKAFSESQYGRSLKVSSAKKVQSAKTSDAFEEIHSCIRPSQYATNFFWQVQ